MMKLLWPIVKGFITFITFAGIVTLGVAYYNSTHKTTQTLNDVVVPQLNYLINADKANRDRDSISNLKLDSTRVVVDFLATDFVNKKAHDPNLTTVRFLEEIGDLKDYINAALKKNESRSYYNDLSMSKIPLDIPFPDELILIPERKIKPIKEK